MTLPRNLERWLTAYLMRRRLRTRAGAPKHLIIAICDHFEPHHDGSMGRVRQWVENADLTAARRPTGDRLRLWCDLESRMASRPDWVLIKLHTHGAPLRNAEMFLGDAMRTFQHVLARSFNDGERFASHYVTAREMVNLIHTAEGSASGDPESRRDHLLPPPPCLAP